MNRTLTLLLAICLCTAAGAQFRDPVQGRPSPPGQEKQSAKGQSVTLQEPLQVKGIRVDSTMMILNSMTVEDYMSIELPPLDTLYLNAYSMSNAVKYYDEEAKYYYHGVKVEQLKPLEWLRIVASASYGNTDIIGVTRSEISYPIWLENSTRQRNFFMNAGLSLNIPIGEMFTTPQRVRQAKAKFRENQYRRDSELDAIKQDIIRFYCDIISGINSLKSAAERLVVAKAQYDFAEKDFVNNKITAEVLYRCKSYETAAVQDFERIKRDINEALLCLEVVSCTKIIK